MDCPTCATSMIEETHHGVTVDRCQSCQGFWFDIEEIQRYLNSRGTQPGQPIPRDPDLAQAESGEPGPCPCCEELALRGGTLRGFEYFRCSWCGGVFLAGSELTKIQRDASVLRPPDPSPRWNGLSPSDIGEFALWTIVGLFTGFD